MKWFFRGFTNLSLKYKFLFMFLFIVILPTLCLGSFIYFQANKVYKNQAYHSTQATLQKIEGNLTNIIQSTENITNYMIYNHDFRSFMMTPKSELNQPYYRQTVDNVKGYVTFQLLSNQYINSVHIEGVNGNTLDFGEPISGDEHHLDDLAKRKKGGLSWSKMYTLKSGWNAKDISIISLSRVINDYDHILQPIGSVRIRLNANYLRDLIGIPDTIIHKGGVYLINQNGDIMLKSPDNHLHVAEDVLQNTKKNSSHIFHMENHKDYLIVNHHVNGTTWKLVAVVNESEIAKEMVHIKKMIRNMIVILTFLGVAGYIGYYYMNIRRIIELTKATEEVDHGHFNINVPISSDDEIGRLRNHFNKMIKAIQYHINIEYRLKMKQSESELQALQSKIDPHFLYNTLDMIRWNARIEGATKTSNLIERLSSIFRNTLRTKTIWTTIIDEFNYLEDYLELQKQRVNGGLTIHIYCEQQIKKALIIKQLIQPLVENAIKHGFYGKRDEKVIWINGFLEKGCLIIQVIDNGKGISEQDFSWAVQNQNGHALHNIEERIGLAFGLEYGLQRLSVNDNHGGACIQIRLPYIECVDDIKRLTKGGIT